MAMVNAKPLELSPQCSLFPGCSVTGAGPGPKRVCLMCGFWTLSRKAFTAGFESTFLKAGAVKQGRLRTEKPLERAQGGCFGS